MPLMNIMGHIAQPILYNVVLLNIYLVLLFFYLGITLQKGQDWESLKKKVQSLFFCEFCMAHYKNNTNVLLHKYGHHYGGFDCTLCPYNSKRRDCLVTHAAKVHHRVLDSLEDYCHTPKRQRVAMTSQAMMARMAEAQLPTSHLLPNGPSTPTQGYLREVSTLPTPHPIATVAMETSHIRRTVICSNPLKAARASHNSIVINTLVRR